MTQMTKHSGRALVAGAAALSMVLMSAAQPAQARGGDITKGVLMGLAAGVAIDQLQRNNWGQAQTTRRYYAPAQPAYSDYRDRSYTPSYYAPSYAAPSYATPGYTSSPLSKAFRSQDKQLRISIQYKLMEQGYYNASLDGLWGPSTQQALMDYARSNNQLSMLTSEQNANQLFSDILR